MLMTVLPTPVKMADHVLMVLTATLVHVKRGILEGTAKQVRC